MKFLSAIIVGIALSSTSYAQTYALNEDKTEIGTMSDLMRDLQVLRSLDHVVTNKDSTFGLYSGQELIMTLQLKDGQVSIKDSTVTFTPELIDFKSEVAEAAPRVESFIFVFTACEPMGDANTEATPAVDQKSCAVVGAVLHLDGNGKAKIVDAI